MNDEQRERQPQLEAGPYTQLPEPISSDDLVTSKSTTYPNSEDDGEYDRQEAFLRSYGAG